MLRPRIIPCLLLRDGGLVKTRRFGTPKYVGDPLNAVRIFNEKEVDELVVLDIDATARGREPDYGLIEKLASECRMPLCYGGGVKEPGQVARLVGLGVEKVAISSAAMIDPGLIGRTAEVVGSQTVVVVLDVARSRTGRYEVVTANGTARTDRCPFETAAVMERLGAGEIVVNSVDRDGMMEGYDLELAQRMRSAIGIPMTVLGGAGSIDHLRDLVREVGTVGVAAGSLFVFKGVYRAVLINYLARAEKDALAALAGGACAGAS